MKISFLVTYYNQEQYVRKSLDSILAIEKPDEWEILVGDDGSSDQTVEIVREYIKEYPQHIKLYVMPRDPNEKYDSVRRASANRLNLLEKMTGDIFCTLDGDDYFCDTNFICEAENIFIDNIDITIVAFGYRYVLNDQLGKEFILPAGVTNRRVDKNLFLRKFYLHAGGCVHRKCFDNKRIEYIKQLGYFDDNNIVINSLNYGEMFAVNRPIYAYRQTGQSVYTSMNELEQAVLNVQGMDVDMKLMDGAYSDVIMQRYMKSFILMYIRKKKLISLLGDEKFKKFATGCDSLKPSLCLSILEYPQIIKPERKKIRKIVENLIKKEPKNTIKLVFKYIIRGLQNE